MSEGPEGGARQDRGREDDRVRAGELYLAACELEALHDYRAALEAYEASLGLHPDEEVEAAARRLMSVFGPA